MACDAKMTCRNISAVLPPEASYGWNFRNQITSLKGAGPCYATC